MLPTRIPKLATSVLRRRHRARADQSSSTRCPPLRLEHRPEITLREYDHQDEEDRQNRIEEIGDRVQEYIEGIRTARRKLCCDLGISGLQRGIPQRIADQSDLATDPGRDQCYHRYRSRSRVDDVRQLLPRDLQTIGDRTHRVPHDQRIRIIIEEDEEPGEPRQEETTSG